MSEPSIQRTLNWNGLTTWTESWVALGEESGAPVVVIHGGPGLTHNYLRNLRALRQGGRQVIFYDQVGNGRSSHLPKSLGDKNFWTADLFVSELQKIVDSYDLTRTGYHLLGQSWGGMLAMQWATTERPGLLSAIVADSPSSMITWNAEAQRLRSLLPKETQAVLDVHEREGTTDSPQYKAATLEFYRRHVCQLDPWPLDFQDSMRHCDEDPTVYSTMIGPTEFHIVGSLSDWDIDRQLHQISVPTLILHGEEDEATDLVVDASRRLIPRAQYVKIAGTSHTPHLEKPEETLRIFSRFLARHDLPEHQEPDPRYNSGVDVSRHLELH